MLLAVPSFALAPPPVNFKREVVKIEGKKYEVTFEGKTVRIREIPPFNWRRFILTAITLAWVFYMGIGLYWIVYLLLTWQLELLLRSLAFYVGFGILSWKFLYWFVEKFWK